MFIVMNVIKLEILSKSLFYQKIRHDGSEDKRMKFQIECNKFPNSQSCLTCRQQFQMKEARLIICNDQGEIYGDVCPECIARGATWIGNRLQQSNQKLSV